jgi:hypothetical protein
LRVVRALGGELGHSTYQVRADKFVPELLVSGAAVIALLCSELPRRIAMELS